VNIVAVEYLVILGGLFLLGTVFGSMLNVCIYRLPREERFWRALKYLVYPPSHCPRCGQRILPIDNVPIFSWLLLRGRCRNCRGSIALRYPLIELLTGALFALLYAFEIPAWFGAVIPASSVYHVLGPSGAGAPAWMTPLVLLHVRYVVHLALVIALIVATFIDIDLRIIPDTVTVPAMIVGVLANCLLGHVYIAPLWYMTPAMAGPAALFANLLLPARAAPGWLAGWAGLLGVPAWITDHPHLHGLCVALAGIIVGGGSVWAVRLAGFWALKREAMGFGDVMLMAMIGSFIGWQGTLIVFLLSLVAAVVIAVPVWLIWRDHELPYGPYLGLGTLILLVSAKWIWPWFDTHVFAMGPFLVPAAVFMIVALAGMLMAWRRIQSALGWGPPEVTFIGEWLPGDQLAYLAGELWDDRAGQWRRPEWPGRLSGRGQSHYETWRRPNNSRFPPTAPPPPAKDS
jgi:leader peptidase (prepilin peptidase)/N-methyltransferase